MSKPFNELRKRLSPEAQERAELLYYELLIGLGKPASKAADWIVDTYMRGAPVSNRLSIEHTIAKAVMEYHPELRALLAERDELRERQHNLEIHEKDCPVFRDFFHKHAIGEMINPSCLVCGKETKRSEAAITHSELADIVVCMRCRDAAQSILNPTLSGGGKHDHQD